MFAAAMLCGALSWRTANALPASFESDGSTPAEVFETMSAQRVPAAAVSFIVLDAATGRVVASHEADTPRSPASTLKVLTTFASLETLGPNNTWHTRALIRGEIDDGVLDGDLILKGGGDPYMTLERWWGFARMLRNRGLGTIHGDIVIDDTDFSLPNVDPGAFDGRPNRSYNVPPDGLMVNFQSVDFTVFANAGARRVEIIADPSPVNLKIENHVRYADGRCSGAARRVEFEVAGEDWDRVVFSGTLSRHCAARSISRVLLKPAPYAYGTFVALWHELGGEFSGKLRIEAAGAGAQPFATYDSLTLAEVVRLTNKFSNNLMARHLLLTMGLERFGIPGTMEKGATSVAEWSRSRGIDLGDVDLDNGSGLSRTTHISVRTLANVLYAAYHSPYAPEFISSLPLGGFDGTLRTRFKGTAGGTVRLKTGHLDGVSGVAGYVTGANARRYVVVCLVNHARADYGAGEPIHAALVQWVLDHP